MADGIIAVAAKAKDWPLLHEAVDIKIEDQREFVQWWDENVSIRHRPPGHAVNPERGLQKDIAEDQSGIAQQQVSRWRKSLSKPDAYHDKLVLAACRKAGEARIQTVHTCPDATPKRKPISIRSSFHTVRTLDSRDRIGLITLCSPTLRRHIAATDQDLRPLL